MSDFLKRIVTVVLASVCGWALALLPGCGESANPDNDLDAGADGGADGGADADTDADMDADTDAGADGGVFDVAEHLIVPADAVAEEIEVHVRCGVFGCDEPDGGEGFDIEDVAEFTVPTEGDYVADWDEIFYFIFASAGGFYTQFFSEVEEGEVYAINLDAIPEYESAIAGVIFATQDFYAPSLVKDQAIHVVGPGGLEFDFETDALGRYGLHDVPAGNYSFLFDYHEQAFEIPITSGDGLTYGDVYFDDPWEMD